MRPAITKRPSMGLRRLQRLARHRHDAHARSCQVRRPLPARLREPGHANGRLPRQLVSPRLDRRGARTLSVHRRRPRRARVSRSRDGLDPLSPPRVDLRLCEHPLDHRPGRPGRGRTVARAWRPDRGRSRGRPCRRDRPAPATGRPSTYVRTPWTMIGRPVLPCAGPVV